MVAGFDTKTLLCIELFTCNNNTLDGSNGVRDSWPFKLPGMLRITRFHRAPPDTYQPCDRSLSVAIWMDLDDIFSLPFGAGAKMQEASESLPRARQGDDLEYFLPPLARPKVGLICAAISAYLRRRRYTFSHPSVHRHTFLCPDFRLSPFPNALENLWERRS